MSFSIGTIYCNVDGNHSIIDQQRDPDMASNCPDINENADSSKTTCPINCHHNNIEHGGKHTS